MSSSICQRDRDLGATGYFRFGTTLRPGLLVGAQLSGWTRRVDDDLRCVRRRRERSGVGLFFVDFGLSPDDGIGLLVTYRTTAAPSGLGVRFAATRGQREGDPHFSGGNDAAFATIRHSPVFPLDVIWTTGVGASYNEYRQLAADLGFDVAFGRNRAPVFRLATSLGDRHAIVAGFHIRL